MYNLPKDILCQLVHLYKLSQSNRQGAAVALHFWSESKLNRQQFLQVVQGSGIEKMKDNCRPAILTTTGSRVD